MIVRYNSYIRGKKTDFVPHTSYTLPHACLDSSWLAIKDARKSVTFKPVTAAVNWPFDPKKGRSLTVAPLIASLFATQLHPRCGTQWNPCVSQCGVVKADLVYRLPISPFIPFRSTSSSCGLFERSRSSFEISRCDQLAQSKNQDNAIMSVEEAPVGYTNGTSFKWNTRGPTIAAATVLPILGLIGVGLRFWSRVHKRSGFGLDDAFIFPALVCLLFATQ